MYIFKFGGASVKNAESVRNLSEILRKFKEKIIVVISAMGKTTNALEQITRLYVSGDIKELERQLDNLKAYHYYIMQGLFESPDHNAYREVKSILGQLESKLNTPPTLNFDFDYDQIVSFGELLSTRIVTDYLAMKGIPVRWMDIRASLKTDNKFREGSIDWELSSKLVRENFLPLEDEIFVTQGFIASTLNNLTTTLGREGSDYTAAILAWILDAEQVTIWKDVPGVLNADPKWFDDTVLLEELTFRDAIELAYYGASIIHPKTIQPLQKKGIPLYVKSFKDPDSKGTCVGPSSYDKLIPSFIFKMNQVLIHISSRDFSFITEESLEVILGAFARGGLRINLMQNTAISFQVCVNEDGERLEKVVSELDKSFNISLDKNLELVTIRYFDQPTIDRVTLDKEILLEQHGPTVAQMVMRDVSQRKDLT